MAHITRFVFCLVMGLVMVTGCSLDSVSCPGEDGKQKEVCGDDCVDLLTDNSNCGTCGNVCKEGEKCKNGECKLTCSAPSVNCGTTCANIKIDINHCGECGHVCDDGEKCDAGECVCDDGLIDCDGKCVNAKADSKNCGACGNSCGDVQVCENGVCACSENLKPCGNFCRNLMNDTKNCGKCGVACLENQWCEEGKCVCPPGLNKCNTKCVDLSSLNLSSCTVCADGFADCDPNRQMGCEVSINNDRDNCGGCGIRCNVNEVCSNGKCVQECDDGLERCDVGCINLSNLNMLDCHTCKVGYCNADEDFKNGCEVYAMGANVDNCGGCGNKCDVKENASIFCSNGECGHECNSGYHEYHGKCEKDSNDHCGKHDNKCGGLEKGYKNCINGVCIAKCELGYKFLGGSCVTVCDSENLWCPEKLMCCEQSKCGGTCKMP